MASRPGRTRHDWPLLYQIETLVRLTVNNPVASPSPKMARRPDRGQGAPVDDDRLRSPDHSVYRAPTYWAAWVTASRGNTEAWIDASC
jgi:hypothetical protein